MSSLIERKFMEELSSLVQRDVKIFTNTGRSYTGRLTGVDPKTLNLCLEDVQDHEGRRIFKVFIPGHSIAQIEGVEKPFDLKGLAQRLERVFPKMVKLYDDAGVIVVMDKIRVSENGILEGTGPAAERVKKVYEEFVKEHKE
ncbi:MAG: Lsm family RNA-binding protein [Candidatus Bathyarchaeia archaeon]|nr:Lsm family RNA-binding protein [Candidatus Bathyarchaeota archaeon]